MKKNVQLLSEKEAAEKLCLSPKTLTNWRLTEAGRNRLSFVKIGKAVRYHLDDVNELANKGTD